MHNKPPMKKFLIATLLFAGLIAAVPNADAGKKHYRDDDRCDRRQSYREDYRPNYRYYEERPVYYRPAPVVRYRSYDHCAPTYGIYRQPAVSFVFGF